MARLPVAVVGVGHLGKEHARILSGLAGVELVGVADPHQPQAEAVAAKCNTQAFTDYRALLGRVQAAVIAAPTSHHHAVAVEFLRHGVHLLVEKPLAATPSQARDMVAVARQHRTVLQVGHIERYNPAFERLTSCRLVPRYIAAERCGGFTGRSTDVGVVLDLMIHDLDLTLALVRSPVARVEAMGVAVLGGNEDIAQARVTFANGCIADLTASRVHPEPRRCMQVWASEGYAGVDFARRRLTLMQPDPSLRQGKLDSRRLDPAIAASLKSELFGRFVQTVELDCNIPPIADQLTRELEEFVRCAQSGIAPRVDGRAGLDALDLAARIVDSLRGHSWEGRSDGPIGPNRLPAPLGLLFTPTSREAA